MHSIIQYILRALTFSFGFFDFLGFMWEFGLAKSLLELVWWSTPSISLTLGAAIPNSMRSNYIISLCMLGVSFLGFIYASQLLYESWINLGIDSTNSILRILFILFVIFRFSYVFKTKIGNN